MMQEVPISEDSEQWASFTSFDFTQPTAKDEWRKEEEEDQQWSPKAEQNDESLLDLSEVWINSDHQSLVSDVEDGQPVDNTEAKVLESYSERMQEMEEQQDMLNSSLLSLTTHFAQVQFRLKQISAAGDAETKEVSGFMDQFILTPYLKLHFLCRRC